MIDKFQDLVGKTISGVVLNDNYAPDRILIECTDGSIYELSPRYHYNEDLHIAIYDHTVRKGEAKHDTTD